MKLTPRPYQQEAHDAAIKWIRQSIDPCLIELPTGAGKSIVVAMLAETIHRISGGKKVLCLQPSKELLEQNCDKFRQTGMPFSKFSASVGEKSTRNAIVFATPQSALNSVSRFCNGDFSAVIIDEGHQISASVKSIISKMREANPNLRACGMTATPFRLSEGYIFSMWPDNTIVTEQYGINQYYTKLVFSMSARELIDMGYLTPPVVIPVGTHYDTSGLVQMATGKFRADTVEQAFVGHGRLTSQIVADVVEKAKGHQSVMLFGSTVKHCHEIMASLPPESSFMITGETPKRERESLLKRFKAGHLKYATSVETLTTGIDITSVSLIAFLRRTESPGLFLQMAGRGLRLHEGKKACGLLDYAENIENLFEDGDIFAPVIKARPKMGEKVFITCTCPDCGNKNEYSARKNDEGYPIDDEGFFLDLDGNRIVTPYGEMPGHYGRRCLGLTRAPNGTYQQCAYRYTFKPCHACEAENDITARRCVACGIEIIDPNLALTLEFKSLKRSPYNRQCDEVLEYSANESLTQSGRECYRVNFKTPYRSFTIWIMKEPKGEREYYALKQWESLQGKKPETVEYQKERSGFYRIFGYNKEVDIEPNS